MPTWNPHFGSSNEQELAPLRIALAPANIDGSGYDTNIYSQAVTASVVGGEPDAVVTWLWTPVASNDGAATNQAAPSTQFFHPNPGNGITVTREWRVVARDQYGQTAIAEVYFNLTGTAPPPPPDPPAITADISPHAPTQARSGAGDVVFEFTVSTTGMATRQFYWSASVGTLEWIGPAPPAGDIYGSPSVRVTIPLSAGQTVNGSVFCTINDVGSGGSIGVGTTFTAVSI